MSFKVAIVGRPNVGKSTLFNRLVGRKIALVDDTPGVTRDRRVHAARLQDLRFDVIDTAGLEAAAAPTLEGRMREQTVMAIDEADLVLFMLDARVGVLPDDETFAELVRRKGKPVIIVSNKTEGRGAEAGVLDAYRLGLGEPIAISAEHGLGMPDLRDAVAEIAGDRIGEVEDERPARQASEALQGDDIDPDEDEPVYDSGKPLS